MIRYLLIVLLGIIVENLCGQYHAVYIPEDKLAGMKMDGDSSDWNWVPKTYFINTDNMVDIVGNNEINTDDWKCKIIVGWNDLINRIYILAVIEDDFSSVDRIPPNGLSYLDDCMEVGINPDNLGGNYNVRVDRYFNIIKFHYSFPMGNPSYEFEIFSGPTWYPLERKYLDWGGKEYKNNSDEKIVRVYEIGTTLWDNWSSQGAEYSKKSQLTFNKNIKLTIAFDDVDNIMDQREAHWVTYSGSEWFLNADQMSVFILDAPVENKVNWQNIEYILNLE